MNNRQNVPGIARGPQNFSPRSLPPISNPMGQPAMQQQAADDVSIQDELAMEIYARLAEHHIMHNHAAPNTPRLRDLAHAAKVAAQAFFEEQTNAQA